MTLYKKEGRKYIPVRDTDAIEGLHNGAWLVIVKDGSRRICQCINPDYVSVQAACHGAEHLLRDKLVELNNKKSLQSPKELTKEQAKAWNKLQSLMVGQMTIIEGPCIQDIVNEFLRFVEEKVIEEFGEKDW